MNPLRKIKELFRPTLTCERVNQFIIDYLEERLSEDMHLKFEKHLAMCPNCDSFFDQYNQTVHLLRDEGQIEVPPNIAEHTLAFLRHQLDNP